MLPFQLVYHEGYDLHLGDHIFPSQKYRLIRDRLLNEGIAEAEDFATPEPASDDDLFLAHTKDWILRLKSGTLSFQEVLRLEIPYSRSIVEAFFLAAGGTTLACRLALRDGLAINIGGGFHHAFADHGEGFCAINDLAVAIRRLQWEGSVERVMVADCDVHQGNGTAYIFAQDRNAFTLSIHQENNYPANKPPSDIDIGLADHTSDGEYLDLLLQHYVLALESFRPQLVLYVAGADPYYLDQLGGLSLTMRGLKERDRLVVDRALRYGIPVAVTLAGGYAYELSDTVSIHVNTVKVARESFEAARLI